MQPHGAIAFTPIVTDKEIGSSLGVCPSVRIYMQDFLVIVRFMQMLFYRVGNTCWHRFV